jgi:PAS domain S-box-containing protein
MFPRGAKTNSSGQPGSTVATLADVAAFLLAVSALLGWGLGSDVLRSFLPGATPMFPITAVAVLASSIASLVGRNRTSKRQSRIGGVLAVAVLVIGVAVLIEYLFGINLGVDRMLFRQTLEQHAAWGSGRIAPNSAFNFVLIGTALLLFANGRNKSTRTAELLTTAAAVIALFGLCGYLYGVPHLYRLSHFTAMSLPTSAAFFLICMSLLAPHVATRQSFGILLGAVLLLSVVSVNTVASLSAARNLIEKNSWVEHTQTVNTELDATLVALLNMETGERGYLYTGDEQYLQPYELGKPELEGRLGNLAELIADNPVQQQMLEQLRTAAARALDFFGKAIALESAGDHEAAKQLVLSGGGTARMEAVRRVLDRMKAEESRLLANRLAEAQRSEHYLLVTIPASHAFTAVLLIFAGLLVSRDLRKRIETAHRFRQLAEREHAAKKETEAAHRRTESVLSGISEMFMLLDHDWKIAYVNEQTVRVTGKSRQDLLGREYWKVFPETVGTIVEAAYRRSRLTRKPERFERFDTVLGRWFSVHLYPSPEALTIFAQDISDLKTAQEALLRAEKLSAVGRMASTVAHEINNPLEAVTNLIWIAKNDPMASESVRKHLGLADEELRRVAHIAKQTLGFYRDASQPRSVKMRDIMESVLALYASRIAGKQISVRTEYDNCDVFAYAGELRQLFANLCGNAIDAVQPHGTMSVKVSLSRDWRDSSQPGIRVVIGDDGCGIPTEHLKSLFEPFFTTKQATGTGLGLWVAKQIAEKHGGWIRVRSGIKSNQHYTVFSVFLPLRDEASLQEFAAAS